ncbi:hypothetical protein LJR143_002460 [Pseudoxanthomonas sp. LjRoot143]|uniref:hypothetical protein n=1 Tax=Pseudoxanthomonas sp. LjRoot143 TaxID=3342266 RepID=UPI003ECF37A5
MKTSSIAAAIGLISLAATSRVLACSPAPDRDMSVEGAVGRSEQIFVAQVIKAELLPKSASNRNANHVVATYRLNKALKGRPPAVGVVVTSTSNCGALLQVGSQVLFFVDLQRTKFGIPEVDGIPTGTQDYYESVEPHRRLMAELQNALKSQPSTVQSTP